MSIEEKRYIITCHLKNQDNRIAFLKWHSTDDLSTQDISMKLCLSEINDTNITTFSEYEFSRLSDIIKELSPKETALCINKIEVIDATSKHFKVVKEYDKEQIDAAYYG